MLVWDLPVRITHWLFVACLAVSWWTAEQRLMTWHRYSGYTLLGLMIFRIYWGFAGSATARFTSFLSGPARGATLSRPAARDARCNRRPYAARELERHGIAGAMLVQVGLGLFVTDIDGLESGPLSHLVSFGTSRALAEAHETMFNVLLAFAGLHVAAILFYLVYERNNLIVAMLTGRKDNAAADSGIEPAPAWRLWAGLGLAALTVGSSFADERLPLQRKLPLKASLAALPAIAVESVLRVIGELAHAPLQLRRCFRIRRNSRTHDGRMRILQAK